MNNMKFDIDSIRIQAQSKQLKATWAQEPGQTYFINSNRKRKIWERLKYFFFPNKEEKC